MAGYRETFRRHRVLFTLPIVISIAFAAWFAFGAPHVYRSTASLWVDNGPLEGSSLDSLSLEAGEAATGQLFGAIGPAPIEQMTVSEQLAAPAFDLAVGDDSLLPRYLKSGARSGFSPTVLLKRGSPSIPYQIEQSLGTQVNASTAGPQVLKLAYNGPTPAVARSVLASLISHLSTTSTIYGNDFALTEQLFFQQAAASAARAVANASASAASYKRQHPSATIQTDPIYAGLVASARKTNSALSTATAAVASTRQGSAGLNAVIRVIDPPSLPSSPMVSVTQTALSLLGGLAAGLLMSLLAVLVATPISRPWDAEFSNASWLKLRWDRRAFAAARRRQARAATHRRRPSTAAPRLRRPA